MIPQLRFSVSRRTFRLQRNINSLTIINRPFSSSSVSLMPRKLKMADSHSGGDNVSKWKDYIRTPRATLDEFSSVTTFGSVRVDSDNLPRIFENSEEVEKRNISNSDEGGAYTETFTKLDAHKNDYLSLLVEHESKSASPFIPIKHTSEEVDHEDFIAKQKFSFGKVRENKTIPVIFEDSKNDMNYFDELIFNDSYSKFSAKNVHQSREVTVDPSIEVAREQIADPDLNLIDQEYFSRTFDHVEEIEIPKIKIGEVIAENDASKHLHQEDLSFIDEQFFTPQAVVSQEPAQQQQKTTNIDTDYVSKPDKEPPKSVLLDMSPNISQDSVIINDPVPSNSTWFESDIDKLMSDSEHKDKMRAKRAEKLLDQSDPFKAFKTPQKKSKAKTSEGPALEYVRKLRKSQNEPTDVKHPHETLGQHWQDRFLAATSNLQKTNRHGNLDNEEEDTEHVALFVDVKKYKPPDLSTYLKGEVRDLLFSKIIYNDHDIVAVWKPYGLPMFPPGKTEKLKGPKQRFSMEGFLPDLAVRVDAEKLYEVHRLDHTTTGVVLYAKTKEMELKLRKLFKEKKVQKTYLCICNGLPQADSGFIDIPVGEGSIGTRRRMTLRPDYSNSSVIDKKASAAGSVSQAVTKYSVVASHDNASLVETKILSGKKHQIRLHLGLGLGCPILGDHKFSYPDQLGKPQKVKGDIVNRLKIRKTKSRDLPIFLHAKRISIPDILPDGNLVIAANLPHFFTKTMQKLRLKYNRRD